MPAAQSARELFAQRLREIRQERGLTGRDLATLAAWQSSKVSKIEHGRQPPSADDVKTWAFHCGAEDQLPDLLASLHAVEGMYVEWRRLEQSGLRHLQESMIGLYERTRNFRVYEPGVIPGLLQTRNYATARLRRIAEFSGLVDDVDSAVAARMLRQRVMTSGNRRFAIVLEDAALYSRIGTVDMMVAQLGNLIGATSLPNVSLGIIPRDIERVWWSSPGFWIFDDGPILLETPSAELTITQPREIAVYGRTFAALTSMAVHGSQARAHIMAAIERIGR